MVNDYTIAVVIPCYQVAQEITGVIERIPDYVDAIIAVNDGSTDDTRQQLERIQCERLTVLCHDENQGLGGAMATGYQHALQAEMDIVVKVDGDGQMDPAYIIELIKPLTKGGCDYTKGNRFLHARELRQMPFTRKVGNILLTFLTKISSGYWHVFDPQNGFLAIHKEFLATLDLDRIRTCRYFFENEMLIQLNIVTARVMDCPMPAVYTSTPSSLYIPEVIRYYPGLLIRGFFSRIFHRYILRDFSIIVPLYFFGFILFCWGGIFGGYNWWYFSTQAQRATPTGTIMLSVLPVILGFQMLITGLVIDILQSPRADRDSV